MGSLNNRLTAILVFCCVLIISGAAVADDNRTEDGLYATLQTNKGAIRIKFTYKQTPLTVCNFISLAEGTKENTAKPLGTPFFDGLIWHRYAANRVIQSGDPTGGGSGTPGYSFPCEIVPSLKHDRRGIVGMALFNLDPKTNGSQFYITHLALPELDGKYTVFGYVVDSAGTDVVMALRKDDKLNKVIIERIGAEAQAFKTGEQAWDSLYNEATGITVQKNKRRNAHSLHAFVSPQGAVCCVAKKNRALDITLCNIQGRLLYSSVGVFAAEGIYTIPINVGSGIYIVKLNQRGNSVVNKVMVP